MKLPFRKNKEFLSALYDILGFYPHNIEIYRIAFSHKSMGFRRDEKTSSKDRKSFQKDKRQKKTHSENTSKPLNNERLEYLGDAVLETVVSDILFRHFSNKREGFLTATRSKIVQREALNHLATQMGLESLIVAAQGTRMSHTNIGGNAFEALMGAIYLDRGYKFCHWFISNRVIGRYVDLDNVAQKEVNFKSKLLEWSQKNRINTIFKDSVSDNGEKGFSTVITIEGIIMGRGSGRSKKESQQEASKEALTRMRKNAQTYDNIFRAKEKRTAMEAEESFALPKIDEIEESLNKVKKNLSNEDAPVLESKKKSKSAAISDEAYDTAYDTSANYEVIDTPPAEEDTDLSFFEEKGIPAPPAEDELRAADERLRKRRTRNRGAKTVGDAVKGINKGTTTAEEKAKKRETERLAEVERQRNKAERKRSNIAKEMLTAEAMSNTDASKEEHAEEYYVGNEQANWTVENNINANTIETVESETELKPDTVTPLSDSVQNEEVITVAEAETNTQTILSPTFEEIYSPITEKPIHTEEVVASDNVATVSTAISQNDVPETSTLIDKTEVNVGDNESEAIGKAVEVIDTALSALSESAAEMEEIEKTEEIKKIEETKQTAPSANESNNIAVGDDARLDTPTTSSITTLNVDDIIFGLSHEHLVSMDNEVRTANETTTMSVEEETPIKPSKSRRKRPSASQKGERKKNTSNKVENNNTASGKEAKKAATPKDTPKTSSEKKSKTNKVDETVAPSSGEDIVNNPKRGSKYRRSYKGKRNNNAKAKQA